MHQQTDLAIHVFSRSLRRACAAYDMTLKELADISGVHPTTISKILNGHMNPTLDTCDRLANALGMPLSDLLVLGQ